MKLYQITQTATTLKDSFVVADSYGEAERIFKEKYNHASIASINLVTDYVLVQK